MRTPPFPGSAGLRAGQSPSTLGSDPSSAGLSSIGELGEYRSNSQARPPLSIVGSYRLLSLIGEGGMGRVYLAEHVKLGRRVALKMLRSEYAGTATAVRRFFDEARAVNQIRHENIIEVTDFFEADTGGDSYFIMELLSGVDLAQVTALGPLDLHRTLHIALQMCSALAAAHEAGIVHRDLKPDNVFLLERRGDPDFVKLLDFGVAKLTDLGQGITVNKTQAGAILGTPEYMSPEQAGGTPVDHRTDVYALGIILYELVTGRRPFNGRSFGEYVVAHLSVVPTRPSQLSALPHLIPDDLERLIMQCLAKPPGERPQSMREVEERLTAIDQQLDVPFRAAGRQGWRSPRRRLAMGGLSLALLGGFAFAARGLSHRSAGPASVSASPAAASVRVSFDSVPRGAEVFREGTDSPLGVTPLELSTERSAATARFEFRLPGRQRAWQEISLGQDTSVSVALAPLVETLKDKPESLGAASGSASAAPARPTVRTPTRKVIVKKPAGESPTEEPALDHDAVADPFAE